MEEKIKILEEIYTNLHSSISYTIKYLKYNEPDKEKLFIKSFSDCVYLESDSPYPILFTLHNAFNNVFGYNKNFPEKWTPLLRSGTVRDWTLRIMDIGSLTRQSVTTMYKNEEFTNVIGLGVARAYLTSEESKLSGMRIILGKEVINQINIVKYDKVSFDCYYAECPHYMPHEEMPKTQKPVKLFFLPITINEEDNNLDLYELCWPVFDYSFSDTNSDIHSRIDALLGMKENFNEKSIRHFKKTAELILKSLIITCSLYPNEYNEAEVKEVIKELQKISETNFN